MKYIKKVSNKNIQESSKKDGETIECSAKLKKTLKEVSIETYKRKLKKWQTVIPFEPKIDKYAMFLRAKNKCYKQWVYVVNTVSWQNLIVGTLSQTNKQTNKNI